MKHLDLFSGIAGFALAARWVWGGEHKIASFCEIEPNAQENLRRNWIGVPIHDDIHSLNGRQYAGIDLLTAGIPCQPYSVAGQRRGNDDDRALWPETLRVIRQSRPRWLVVENVTGFISLALDGVLSDLESAGYSARTVVLPALALNAAHLRRRVWIMAYDTSWGWNHKAIAQPGELPRRQSAWEDRGRGRALGNAHSTRQLQSQGVIREERGRNRDTGQALAYPDGQRRQERNAPTITSGTWFYSGGRDWSRSIRIHGYRIPLPEPGVLRVADGVSSRMGGIILPMTNRDEPGRVAGITMLGNAIVPQVAAEIFLAMQAVDMQIGF